MNNCCDESFQDGGVINNTQIINPEIIGGILKGVTLQGGVTLDDVTAMVLANRLCPLLSNCILEAVEGAALANLTLVNPSIKGQVTLDLDAVASIANALSEKITQIVDDFLTGGTFCCLHLEGAEINNSHGVNNVWTNTTLNGDTVINGNLNLDNEAIGNLCQSLGPCIDARVGGTSVITDGTTILGDGTQDNPIRANQTEETDPAFLPPTTTGTELPTTIIGNRTQLLGRPDAFIRQGDYVLPVWKV